MREGSVEGSGREGGMESVAVTHMPMRAVRMLHEARERRIDEVFEVI